MSSSWWSLWLNLVMSAVMDFDHLAFWLYILLVLGFFLHFCWSKTSEVAAHPLDWPNLELITALQSPDTITQCDSQWTVIAHFIVQVSFFTSALRTLHLSYHKVCFHLMRSFLRVTPGHTFSEDTQSLETSVYTHMLQITFAEAGALLRAMC